MTDNEFHDEDESFQGYTDEQVDAVHHAIKPYLRPDADWVRILFEITTFMSDLHPNPVLRASDIERRLKVFETKLDAAEPHSSVVRGARRREGLLL